MEPFPDDAGSEDERSRFGSALLYISELPFLEAEHNLKTWGKVLLGRLPEDTTRLLARICTEGSAGWGAGGQPDSPGSQPDSPGTPRTPHTGPPNTKFGALLMIAQSASLKDAPHHPFVHDSPRSTRARTLNYVRHLAELAHIRAGGVTMLRLHACPPTQNVGPLLSLNSSLCLFVSFQLQFSSSIVSFKPCSRRHSRLFS